MPAPSDPFSVETLFGEMLRNYAAYASMIFGVTSDDNRISGGSCFFVDTGTALFGVTAAHVARELIDTEVIEYVGLTPRNFSQEFSDTIDLPHPLPLLDIDEDLDIATFDISADIVSATDTEIVSVNGADLCACENVPQLELAFLVVEELNRAAG